MAGSFRVVETQLVLDFSCAAASDNHSSSKSCTSNVKRFESASALKAKQIATRRVLSSGIFSMPERSATG